MRWIRKERERILRDCLERIEEGESPRAVLADYPAQAQALRSQLEAAAWLRQRRDALDPRPGFVGASRRRLIERARERSAKRVTTRRWDALVAAWSWPGARRQLVVQLTLLLLLLASAILSGSKLAQAAPAWLPGDALYSLKTFGERAELTLAPGAAWDARLHIEFAQRRLLEVQALALENRYEELSATVTGFAYHVQQAVKDVKRVAQRDPERARVLALELQRVLSRQGGLVTILAAFAPPQTQVEFERVIYVSEDGVLGVRDVLSPGSGESQTLVMRVKHGESICWARQEEGGPAT